MIPDYVATVIASSDLDQISNCDRQVLRFIFGYLGEWGMLYWVRDDEMAATFKEWWSRFAGPSPLWVILVLGLMIRLVESKVWKISTSLCVHCQYLILVFLHHFPAGHLQIAATDDDHAWPWHQTANCNFNTEAVNWELGGDVTWQTRVQPKPC